MPCLVSGHRYMLQSARLHSHQSKLKGLVFTEIQLNQGQPSVTVTNSTVDPSTLSSASTLILNINLFNFNI